MAVIDDTAADTLPAFVRNHTALGATVHTDGWEGYRSFGRLGFDHRPRRQRAARASGEDPGEILPRVHRVISNLKSCAKAPTNGVSGEHLQVYLGEYTFRFNRRRIPMAVCHTLLGLQASHMSVTSPAAIVSSFGVSRVTNSSGPSRDR